MASDSNFNFKSFIAGLAARSWLWWLGIVIWATVLFVLSGRSTLPPGPQIPYQDKVIHFLYFSGGGFCFATALLGGRLPLSRGLLWMIAGLGFGMVIGALDEYHQTFTPGRSGNDPGDWLADLLGAGTGGLLAWGLFSRFKR